METQVQIIRDRKRDERRIYDDGYMAGWQHGTRVMLVVCLGFFAVGVLAGWLIL